MTKNVSEKSRDLTLQKCIGLFASKQCIFFIFYLALIVFLTPNLLRDRNDGLIGEEAYFSVNIAKHMLDDGFLKVYDEFSYGGREYNYLFPWATLLAMSNLAFKIPLEILSVFLPYFFALLSFILVGFILQSFLISTEKANIGMLLLAISPSFLFLSSLSNKHVLPFFISLLAFWCFYNKSKILRWLSFGLFLLLSFFSLTMTFIALFLLLVYTTFYQKERVNFFWAICGSVILLSVLGIFFPIISTSPFLDLFSDTALQDKITGINPFFMVLVSDFGGQLGISIFVLVLFIIGLFFLWLQKGKIGPIIISLLFLIFLSAKKVEPLIYLNVFAVMLAAIGIIEIAKLRWVSTVMKHFTLLLILYGVIFSSLSYIKELQSALPNEDILKSLTFMKKETPLDSTVLSYHRNGFWIETLAQRKTVMDSYFIGAPRVEERYNDLQNLFRTRNIDIAMEILKKYDVDYVYIDKAMKQELWKYDEEGFLFLLKYSNNFKKVYLSDFVEIWGVET